MNSLLSSILLLTNVVVTAVKDDQDAADTDAVFQNVHPDVIMSQCSFQASCRARSYCSYVIRLSVNWLVIISINFHIIMIMSFD